MTEVLPAASKSQTCHLIMLFTSAELLVMQHGRNDGAAPRVAAKQ